MGWGHALTLANLLPKFLEFYLQANPEKVEWIQEFLDWFALQDQIKIQPVSEKVMKQAVCLACSRNARIFEDGNDLELYYEILELGSILSVDCR